MKTFIVEIWSKVFDLLRWISPFHIIRALIPATRGSYIFIDAWVLGNLLLSIALFLICSLHGKSWFHFIAVGYGSLRVFEIIVYQINVMFFDEYQASKHGVRYAIRGFRRIVLLLLHNYVETIFWFALFYANMLWAFEKCYVNTCFAALNFSFSTMTTFGHCILVPNQILTEAIILVQSVVGFFMVLVILARFISLIPNPESLDKYEK